MYTESIDMELPLLTRYADILRYDHARGIAAAIDWRSYPTRRDFAEYPTAETSAQAIAAAAVGSGPAAAYLAGYGLALAARAWADRPAETRRAAIIQAGEWLRRARPFDLRFARIVEEGLARADAAILAGGDAEATLLEYVDSAIKRADRVAERCGWLAAGLLDQGDHVLTHGFAGPALNWLLALAHGEDHKQLRLTITTPPAQPDTARLAAVLAAEIGVPVACHHDVESERIFINQTYDVMFIGADRMAMDGGVAAPSASATYVALARQHSIPCYVLGYDGPDPSCATTSHLSEDLAAGATANNAIVPPEQISAIITNRGIYRPEMIARYLGDGDTLLDVIPLT
jgi:methylthioribose-1-phosphate isomerase